VIGGKESFAFQAKLRSREGVSETCFHGEGEKKGNTNPVRQPKKKKGAQTDSSRKDCRRKKKKAPMTHQPKEAKN